MVTVMIFAVPERPIEYSGSAESEQLLDLGFDRFSQGVAGKCVDEDVPAGHLRRHEPLLAPSPQGVAVVGRARRRDDGDAYPFTPLGVLDADDGTVGDVRVGAVHLLDLQSRDLLA